MVKAQTAAVLNKFKLFSAQINVPSSWASNEVFPPVPVAFNQRPKHETSSDVVIHTFLANKKFRYEYRGELIRYETTDYSIAFTMRAKAKMDLPPIKVPAVCLDNEDGLVSKHINARTPTRKAAVLALFSIFILRGRGFTLFLQ